MNFSDQNRHPDSCWVWDPRCCCWRFICRCCWVWDHRCCCWRCVCHRCHRQFDC